MYVIIGGTGNVGSSTAAALLDRGEEVTIVTRNPDVASRTAHAGARIAMADVTDADALRSALSTGRRAMLLCPPADPAGDTDAEEHRRVDAILAALEGSRIEKVVAISTYGVQRGDRIGDLGTLWRLEDGLTRLAIPSAVNRGAYYLTNWDPYLDVIREAGVLPSMLPPDLLMPMVSPVDVGQAAAQRLTSPLDDVGIRYVEGPERYTPRDVADAFAAVMGRAVDIDVTPRGDLEVVFAGLGFSAEAAESYAHMTRRTIDGVELPENPWRGTITLREHIEAIVRG